MKKELIKYHYLAIQLFLGLLFGLLLFPSGVKSIIIAVFALLIISLCFKRKFFFRKFFFLLNASVYLLLICTIIYSENLELAFKKLETMASLMIFPLLFSFINDEEIKLLFAHLNKYLWIYISSVFLLNSAPFLWYLLTNYSFEDIIKHYNYIIIVDIGKYSIHPIYIAMHCCLAIIFSIHLYKTLKNKVEKIILICINISLILFLLIYARKGPVLAFIVTLAIVSFINKSINLKYSFYVILALTLLLIAVPKTRNRFIELTKIERSTNIDSNSTNKRYSIYLNTIKLITESPLFGYGIGDYNDVLSKKYIINKERALIGKNYNSHNQYFSFTLIGGFLLLLLFLVTQIINIKNCVKNHNEILIMLLIFFGLLMCTENILEREYGVIFFAFFLNFFNLKNYIKFE